jgi:hypothetical protein
MVSIIAAVTTGFAVNVLLATTSSLYTTIIYLTTSDKLSTNKLLVQLKEIDLEYTVSIIREVAKECTTDHASIKKALLGVNEILEQINCELLKMKEGLDYHNTKYLSSWRRFSFDLATLKQHKNILDNRYKLLIDLLKIYK